MKSKLLLIVIAVTFILAILAIVAFPGGDASAQAADKGPIRIDVSRNGFNNTRGEFRLEVEEGQEVVITFIYGDGDLSQDNPHIIFISSYNIQTDTLDQANPEVTVRFTAGRPAEVSFMCTLYCIGHENLQGGRITILPTTKPPTEGEEGALLLTASEQAQSGQPLTLTAVLRDSQGKPIKDATIKFFIKVDFFTSGLMEIGKVVTNDQGVAILEYTSRLTGEIQIVAHHEGKSHEIASTVNLMESGGPFYQAEAGIQFPTPGPEVFIGPGTPLELGEGGEAPITVFRPPSGVLSWLSPLLLAVMAIWATYFYVIYQLFRIPIASEIGDTETRLVPLAGLAIVMILGILLVLMLITGPYSHLHLLR